MALSRSVSATVSRISARFPPTSRWMLTARTAHLKSALPTRSASASSASSDGRPSRISATTRWNSEAAGWAISLATASSDCRKLCPARRDDAMMVSTSGSCSLSLSARLVSAARRMTVGATAPTAAKASAMTRFWSNAAPKTPASSAAPTVPTTNSPERRLTPAASSCASSRSLNPLAWANRDPKADTCSGIHPVPGFMDAPLTGCCPGFITARIRASTSRSCLARAALPSRNHTSKNATTPTTPATASCAEVLVQKDSASISPSPPERTGPDRRTRRARRAFPGTWA